MNLQSFNTYNTYDLLQYTLLPSGFTIGLSFKDYSTGQILKDVALGRTGDNAPMIRPIDHSLSGDFVRYTLKMGDIQVEVTYASNNESAAICISPLVTPLKSIQLCLYSCFLWNFDGFCYKDGNSLIAKSKNKYWRLCASGNVGEDLNTNISHPQLLRIVDKPIFIYTDDITDPKTYIENKSKKYRSYFSSNPKYKCSSDLYQAMHAAIAWNTFYEPNGNRIITGVSRDWNVYHGGYVLFCWDSFFSSLLCAEFSQKLAENNFFAILHEQYDLPFIPNSSSGSGFRTLDRSQPPIGSMVALKLFKKYENIEFLEQIYPKLKQWNQWFWENRQIELGLFTWGSTPYPPVVGNEWETNGVGNVFGAALESGMDNSPLYRDVGWNKEKNLIDIIDVGLSALFIHDCKCLYEIADLLQKKCDTAYLYERQKLCEDSFLTLWCEEEKMFLNRIPNSNKFVKTLSAVHFYSFFHSKLQKKHIDGLLAKFFDENEFFSTYMIASIAKSDPDYKRQNYWQGRIWPPHNYIVHEAMTRYQECDTARKILAQKSKDLLLTEWKKYGHVHENYNAENGSGCEISSDNRIPGSSSTFGSGCLYNWGGLLALLALEED